LEKDQEQLNRLYFDDEDSESVHLSDPLSQTGVNRGNINAKADEDKLQDHKWL
jgi:hypothetical protein